MEKSKAVNGTVWLCDTFPRKISDFVPIFEVLAPSQKHFTKLQQFVEMIPDTSFPIKLGECYDYGDY
jgi:hypothetical protein